MLQSHRIQGFTQNNVINFAMTRVKNRTKIYHQVLKVHLELVCDIGPVYHETVFSFFVFVLFCLFVCLLFVCLFVFNLTASSTLIKFPFF